MQDKTGGSIGLAQRADSVSQENHQGIAHLTYYRMYRDLMNYREEHQEYSFFPSTDASQRRSILWGHLQEISAISRNLQADLPQDDYLTLWDVIEYLTLKVQAMVKEEEWLMQYLISYAAGYTDSMEDK